TQWYEYWFKGMSSAGEQRFDDSGAKVPRSFPMLSLFDRLKPAKSEEASGISHAITLLRRGGHNLNMSQAVAAGELVILAQANDQPLPFGLTVAGDKVAGEGTVYYQFALPLDRG